MIQREQPVCPHPTSDASSQAYGYNVIYVKFLKPLNLGESLPRLTPTPFTVRENAFTVCATISGVCGGDARPPW